ncbi:MAG: response regulator transcription factor [bacterium]
MTPGTGGRSVVVVDDDRAVCTALSRLLRAHGWSVEVFPSAEAFLARDASQPPACLVLDVNLPGLDGLDLQRRLGDAGQAFPILFMTGYGDIPMSVRAMKAGATDFLTKPVCAEVLLAAVLAAVDASASDERVHAERAELRARFESLSAREREVLAGLAAGKLNKQVAGDLGIVEQTVKFHRARIMERMQAKSAAELMLIAAKLELG